MLRRLGEIKLKNIAVYGNYNCKSNGITWDIIENSGTTIEGQTTTTYQADNTGYVERIMKLSVVSA